MKVEINKEYQYKGVMFLLHKSDAVLRKKRYRTRSERYWTLKIWEYIYGDKFQTLIVGIQPNYDIKKIKDNGENFRSRSDKK